MHFAICDFLLDIVQNSVEADSRTIRVCVFEEHERITVSVEDDGKGMSEEELERAKDPFYTDGLKHARRKVGLGIPFLLQSLELAGGTYTFDSRKGEGTLLSFCFPADSLDTPPLGDVAGMLLSAMCFDGDYELIAQRRAQAGDIEYEIKRSEILEAVGTLTDAGALVSVREFLVSQEAYR